MPTAFAVAAAVAVLAILTVVLTARQAAARVAAERSHAERLEAELESARQARAEAERRLQQDERALGAAAQRAEVSERRATHAEGRLAAAAPLWELERLRLEREWADVTGTPAPLPEPWDGSVRAAIAVELEIIREVIGIPTRLHPDSPGGPGGPRPHPGAPGRPPPGAGGAPGSAVDQNGSPGSLDPITTLGAARLAGEVLRALARVGEEMVVSVEPAGCITMTIATEGAGRGPDLAPLAGAAAALGGDLAVHSVAGGLEARLRLPARMS